MTTKENLKAIEKAAFEGEKKRIAAEKKAIKESKDKSKAVDDANEAAMRGIAKAQGRVYVSKKTKKSAATVGRGAAKVGRLFKRGAKYALEQRAKNIAEQERIDKKAVKAKKAASARKAKAKSKPKTKKKVSKK